MTNQIITWDISMQMRCKCEGHVGDVRRSLHSRFCFVEVSDSGAVGRAGRAKTFHLRKWFECENKRGS